MMNSPWFPADIMLGIEAKEFNLWFIRPENFGSHGLRVLQVAFGKLPVGCRVPFTEEWCLSGHSTIQARLVECSRNGCPVEEASGSWSPCVLPRSLKLAAWPVLGRDQTSSIYAWWRPLCLSKSCPINQIWQIDSNQVVANMWKMISKNRMYLSSTMSVMAKAVIFK